jgi:hypothetical protein
VVLKTARKRAVFRFPVNPLDIFQLCPGLRQQSLESRVTPLRSMKMLFFSSDNAEVKGVSEEFAHAGIPCEIRASRATRGRVAESELWIRNDRDCHRAFLLCVQLGIGFAKRAVQPVEIEWWS